MRGRMTELNELYWAWALVPLPARDALGGAAGLRIRLIAPEGPLRRAAAKFLQIGGTSSDPAPASPPLQDKIQVVLAGSLEQFERMVMKIMMVETVLGHGRKEPSEEELAMIPRIRKDAEGFQPGL